MLVHVIFLLPIYQLQELTAHFLPKYISLGGAIVQRVLLFTFSGFSVAADCVCTYILACEIQSNLKVTKFMLCPSPTPRDAEDAVYARDGYDYDGYRLRVEFPRSGRGMGRGGFGGAPRGRYGPPSRRSEYRVIVSGQSLA